MATKTISIDMEAYKRLKGSKKEGESFSEAIKRLVPKPFDFKKWLDDLAANPASDEFIEAVERVIADRRAPQNMGARDAVLGHHAEHPDAFDCVSLSGRRLRSGPRNG